MKLEQFEENFKKAEQSLSQDEALLLFKGNKNTEKFAEERIDEFFYEWYLNLNGKRVEELEAQLILFENTKENLREQQEKNEKLGELALLVEDEKEKLFEGVQVLKEKIEQKQL